MEYVITNKGDVAIGRGFHQELSKYLEGNVVSAGQCEFLEDGWTVFGMSYGFGIKAKNSDREILNRYYPDGKI